MGKTVLVTEASGFLGHQLVVNLIAKTGATNKNEVIMTVITTALIFSNLFLNSSIIPR